MSQHAIGRIFRTLGSMHRLWIAIGVLAAVAGFVLGRTTASPQGTAPYAGQPSPGTVRETVPRMSLAEQHTVYVGEGAGPPAKEDADGRLMLMPAELQRVLEFEAEDVDVALAAVERFVAGVRPDFVEERAPGRVLIQRTRLLWRVEGEGAKRVLRVVALPADPYGSAERAGRLAEAIAQWCIVSNVYSRTVTSFEGQVAGVTTVRAPNVKGVMPVFDAAEAEFQGRGMTLVQEDVVQDAVIAVARAPDGALLWSFFWSGDQSTGTFGVYHHADPFDTAGEQEMLLAVLRRALGRDVRIRLGAYR